MTEEPETRVKELEDALRDLDGAVVALVQSLPPGTEAPFLVAVRMAAAREAAIAALAKAGGRQ